MNLPTGGRARIAGLVPARSGVRVRVASRKARLVPPSLQNKPLRGLPKVGSTFGPPLHFSKSSSRANVKNPGHLTEVPPGEQPIRAERHERHGIATARRTAR